MKLNEFVLKRLYNPDHVGRGTQGKVNRREVKITITPQTYLALEQVVRIGPGLYGSAAINLFIRVALALIGQLDLIRVAEEFALTASEDKHTLANNLRKMADFIDVYEPVTAKSDPVKQAVD